MDKTNLINNDFIKYVKAAAADVGEDIYIIGGLLRDKHLGRVCRDHDFVVFGDIHALTERVAKLVSRPLILIGKGDKEVIRIVKEGATYDFTLSKGATLKEDVAHRDFTINTLAYSLKDDTIIDILGAESDINNKIIRAVSDATFDEDPLRMLRAFRFMAELSFTIDERALELIREKCALIKNIAGERIREELFMIFEAEDSYATIKQMTDTGLLYEIFPELIDSIGCAQNDYHHLDVMEHVLCAYEHLEQILTHITDYFPSPIEGFLRDSTYLPTLKYALLLHDVAKPETKSVGDDGRVHFYKHAEIGELRVGDINTRLHLSKKADAFTSKVVRHHLRIVPFLKLLDEDRVTKRSILRFFLRTGEEIGPYVIIHNLADLMASRGIKRATKDEVKKVVTLSNMMLDVYFNEFLVQIKNPPLITGRYLIDALGLTPSPIFKEILGKVYDKQITGEVKTNEEARKCAEEFVKRLIK